MDFALTTRWNANRHASGEAMIEEILELGFERVELGYDTRLDLVPGIRAMVDQGAVQIDSLHNFCPVPMGAGRGHPEVFTFASRERRVREQAIRHTAATLRFAAELGAKVVVSHSGNVDMKRLTMELVALAEAGQQFTPRYDRIRTKLVDRREKKARKQLPHLFAAVEQLMPVMQETGVQLALEILPTWEAFPTEMEFVALFAQFGSEHLRYWHDIGHARIRENLGLISMERWLERLRPHLAGMHLHDVAPPGRDHVMPPDGDMDFTRYATYGRMDILRVMEPVSNAPAETIVRGREVIRAAWEAGGEAVASEAGHQDEERMA